MNLRPADTQLTRPYSHIPDRKADTSAHDGDGRKWSRRGLMESEETSQQMGKRGMITLVQRETARRSAEIYWDILST